MLIISILSLWFGVAFANLEKNWYYLDYLEYLI